jgi:hypothetical protein
MEVNWNQQPFMLSKTQWQSPIVIGSIEVLSGDTSTQKQKRLKANRLKPLRRRCPGQESNLHEITPPRS